MRKLCYYPVEITSTTGLWILHEDGEERFVEDFLKEEISNRREYWWFDESIDVHQGCMATEKTLKAHPSWAKELENNAFLIAGDRGDLNSCTLLELKEEEIEEYFELQKRKEEEIEFNKNQINLPF